MIFSSCPWSLSPPTSLGLRVFLATYSHHRYDRSVIQGELWFPRQQRPHFSRGGFWQDAAPEHSWCSLLWVPLKSASCWMFTVLLMIPVVNKSPLVTKFIKQSFSFLWIRAGTNHIPRFNLLLSLNTGESRYNTQNSAACLVMWPRTMYRRLQRLLHTDTNNLFVLLCKY